MFDARSNQNAQNNTLKSDIESAQWDPCNPVRIIFSCEDGSIGGIDARKFESDFLFYEKAHNKACTSVSMSAGVDGLMASTGLDGFVKVWDIKDNLNPIFSKDMKAEKLFCGSFYPNNPWLFGCGSGLGEMVIWDLGVAGNIANHFGPRA